MSDGWFLVSLWACVCWGEVGCHGYGVWWLLVLSGAQEASDMRSVTGVMGLSGQDWSGSWIVICNVIREARKEGTLRLMGTIKAACSFPSPPSHRWKKLTK